MTKEQVIGNLKTNPMFALTFAVDNNPSGVVASLANNGILMPPNTVDFKSWALSTLTDLIKVNKQKTIKVITETPYNKGEDAADYTKNLLDFFMLNQPASTVTASQKFSLDALLGGLGSGLSTYSGISLADSASTNPLNAQQVEAAKLQADADAAAKKKKMYIIIASIGGGLILLSVIIYFATKKKKETN